MLTQIKKYPIDQRNKQLQLLFENAGFSTKLIGDCNQPKIIINDMFAVSGYVHNRLYHFTSKPFGGEIVRTVNLHDVDITASEIAKIFDSIEQRRFFRLVLKTDEKCFFLKTENSIPMFAFNDSRFWFDEQKASQTKKYLFEDFNIDCYMM